LFSTGVLASLGRDHFALISRALTAQVFDDARSRREFQTPQVPPKPKVTLPFSTMTGTSRLPSDQESIRFMLSGEALTLTYSKGIWRLAKSARAADV